MPCALVPLTIETKSVNGAVCHAREVSVILYWNLKSASVQDKETPKTVGHRRWLYVLVHSGSLRLCVWRSSPLAVSSSTLYVDFPTNGSKARLSAHALPILCARVLCRPSHALLCASVCAGAWIAASLHDGASKLPRCRMPSVRKLQADALQRIQATHPVECRASRPQQSARIRSDSHRFPLARANPLNCKASRPTLPLVGESISDR